MKLSPSLQFMALWKHYRGCPLIAEYRFHEKRKWRFDFAIPSKKIAIEIDGGIFMRKSRHTSAIGYSKDCEKFLMAVFYDWKVIRLPGNMITPYWIQQIVEFERVTNENKIL